MAIGTLLSSSYLQLLSSLGTASVAQKPAQPSRNPAPATSVSPRMGPDTYTPGRSSSDDVSVFGALPYAVPVQNSATAEALAAAKQTAQRDADAAAQAERNNAKDSLVTLSQLSRDMTVLARLTQANAANQAADGASNPALSDSIVFTVDTPSGSIAAIAADSSSQDGSGSTSSVAYVGTDGSMQAVGQGSTIAADGSTRSANVSLSTGASTDAVGSFAVNFSADASLGTVAATTQKMELVAAVTGAAPSDSLSGVNAFSADSSSPAAGVVADGSSLVLSGYQYSPNDAATSAYGVNASGGMDGVWNYDTDAGVSFYA